MPTIHHAVRIADAIVVNIKADIAALAVVQTGFIPAIVQAVHERDRTEDDLLDILPAVAVVAELESSERVGADVVGFYRQSYNVVIEYFAAFDPNDADAWANAVALGAEVSDTFANHPIVTADGVLATDDTDATKIVRVDWAEVDFGPRMQGKDRNLKLVWFSISGTVRLESVPLITPA